LAAERRVGKRLESITANCRMRLHRGFERAKNCWERKDCLNAPFTKKKKRHKQQNTRSVTAAGKEAKNKFEKSLFLGKKVHHPSTGGSQKTCPVPGGQGKKLQKKRRYFGRKGRRAVPLKVEDKGNIKTEKKNPFEDIT